MAGIPKDFQNNIYKKMFTFIAKAGAFVSLE